MKKKAAPKVVNEEVRPFIDHLVIDKELLEAHKLGEVVELLEVQDWERMFLNMFTLNTELAHKFFFTFVITGEDEMMLGQFTIDGKPHQFTVRELGLTLGVPTTGFNQYARSNGPIATTNRISYNKC